MVGKILYPRNEGQCCLIVRAQIIKAIQVFITTQSNMLKNDSVNQAFFLRSINQVLYLPGRHIPIDTSLCSQSPQVRIYGFVAAGINALRACKKNKTHKTFKAASHSAIQTSLNIPRLRPGTEAMCAPTDNKKQSITFHTTQL